MTREIAEENLYVQELKNNGVSNETAWALDNMYVSSDISWYARFVILDAIKEAHGTKRKKLPQDERGWQPD